MMTKRQHGCWTTKVPTQPGIYRVAWSATAGKDVADVPPLVELSGFADLWAFGLGVAPTDVAAWWIPALVLPRLPKPPTRKKRRTP